MIFILALGIAGLGYFMYSSGAFNSIGSGSTSNSDMSTHGVNVSKSSLPDCEPANQGGNWDTSNDGHFIEASIEFNVPFALLKAHAIRESALNASAYHFDYSGAASYGLMQVEYFKGKNRFASLGYTDDALADGGALYDPVLNCRLGAWIISKNLQSSAYPTLRDVINAYNTGTTEAKHAAPNNYVNDVLKNYETLIGSQIP